MTPPPSSRRKHLARAEFDRWSQTYDRSILQRVLFRPTYEILLEETYRWRQSCAAGADAPFFALDVGCGTGSWAAMLRGSSLPACVVGLDYSFEMCRQARAKVQQAGAGEIGLVNGDSQHLPFADESIDLITCTHSFHHYPHQAEVVREMHRVLRPGGMLLLVDGFRDNVIGWFVFDVFVTRAEGDVHHASWSEMRRMFLDAGFADVRQRKFNIWAPALVTIGHKQ